MDWRKVTKSQPAMGPGPLFALPSLQQSDAGAAELHLFLRRRPHWKIHELWKSRPSASPCSRSLLEDSWRASVMFDEIECAAALVRLIAGSFPRRIVSSVGGSSSTRCRSPFNTSVVQFLLVAKNCAMQPLQPVFVHRVRKLLTGHESEPARLKHGRGRVDWTRFMASKPCIE